MGIARLCLPNSANIQERVHIITRLDAFEPIISFVDVQRTFLGLIPIPQQFG